MQVRIGPNRVGPLGLLQPFADVFKLIFKEIVVPTGASRALFFIAPILAIGPAVAAWAVVPLTDRLVIADIDAGHALRARDDLDRRLRDHPRRLGVELEVRVHRRAALGRADRQLRDRDGLRARRRADVRVEPQLPRDRRRARRAAPRTGTCGRCCRCSSSTSSSGIAETNRHPFDLAEGESEIVAGFHVEYSGVAFAVFFLAEYMNMILIAVLASVMFLGGWLSPFPILNDVTIVRASRPSATASAGSARRSRSSSSSSCGCARPSRATATTR